MEPVNAARVTRSYTQHLDFPPERVFPLLCPVREREWVDGWEARVVHSKSGVAEEGCVFTTSRPGEADTVWTITHHDERARHVEFVMVTPDSRVGELRIDVRPDGDSRSLCDVTYTFTALTPHGDRYVEEFTEEAYLHRMRHWEAAVNHYLATGETLRAHS